MMKKKIIACFIATVLMLQAFGVGATIYKDIQTEQIAQGITRQTVQEFYGNSWMTYHVITADLSQPNVSLRVLTSPSGVSYLDNVMTMAKDSDIVAAINADFFDTTIGGGRSSMLGLTVQDGEITSSSSVDRNLAALAMTEEGTVLMDYFRTFLYAFTDDGISQEIVYVNKFHNAPALSMYTSAWGKTSRGSEGNMIELVCVWNEEEGSATVTGKYLGSGPVTIPENGFILRTDNSINGYLNANFEIGDTIRVTMALMPDEGKIQEAVGGGTLLVKDGKKAEFTNVISGMHPRSAVGVSRDGRKIFLVAVDGRQSYASGMTQEQLANLLISLGAYTALNLDGGGSTTMVERDLFAGGLTVTNTPSDGALRKVSSSIGIASSYDGNLVGLRISANDDAVFANTGLELKIMGLDKYQNPVVLPPDAQIEWSVSGVEGEFKDNLFVPLNGGTAEITATYKEVSGTVAVEVYDTVFSIEPSVRDIALDVGASKTVSFTGYDKSGRSAVLRQEDVAFYGGELASYNDGKVTGLSTGYGTATFSIGEVKSFVRLKVGAVTSQDAEDFEKLNATFMGYPDGVTGAYSTTGNKQIARTQLGKLDYVFAAQKNEEEAVQTKAAYAVFDTPKILPENISEIKLLVHSASKQPLSVKAYLTDSYGNAHYVTLADSINWTGWKTLAAPVNENLAGGQLERIYVVYAGTDTYQGSIYMDDLSFNMNVAVDLPEDITGRDARNTEAEVAPGGFRFYVIAANSDYETLLNRQAEGIFQNKVENGAYSIYLGSYVNEPFVPAGTKFIQTGTDFRVNRDNATFITLKSAGSISATGWEFLTDNLEDAEKNVFLFLPTRLSETDRMVLDGVLGACADRGHELMVFYKGDSSFQIREGVRYFGISDSQNVRGNSVIEKLHNLKAVSVCVNPDKTTYEYVTAF